MRAVLKFENRSIQDIYFFILTLTVVVIIETLMTGESSTLPNFLIGSAIGHSLFWLIEFVVWRFSLLGRTKQTKYLQSIIFFSRFTILGGLLYFLFATVDIIYAIITCIFYFGSMWLGSRKGDSKRGTNIEMFDNIQMIDLATYGLKIILTFCIGYFVGKWVGEYFGNAEIGANIGLVLGFVAASVQGHRLEQLRRDAQKA